LLLSHLACADEPGHPLNAEQLDNFLRMTEGTGLPRSLSATGGILLGPAYHFDLTRPGIGLYGAAPFVNAAPVVGLTLPVIQTRMVRPGEPVGYSCTWVAKRPSLIATVAAGYADGVLRSLSNRATVFAGDVPCPVVGRVSMDLITVDVTHLTDVPEVLELMGPHQSVDDLAEVAGTNAYEILTRMAPRLTRIFAEAEA
jgi:alanine racemase